MTPILTHIPSCGSTNDEARRLLSELTPPSPGPVVVTADEQTGGRGRLGSRWCSPRGGLWMTVGSVDAASIDAGSSVGAGGGGAAGGLPLLVGLAVCRGIERLAGDELDADTRIKWPNDVLLRGRKVAGVLIERVPLRAGPTATLVGIGVNANLARSDLAAVTADGKPLPIEPTTLRAEFGRDVDLAALRDAIVSEMTELVRTNPVALGEPAIEEITPRLAYRGSPVEVRVQGAIRDAGVLRGIDPTGRLELESAGGVSVVESGAVSLRPSKSRHNEPAPVSGPGPGASP